MSNLSFARTAPTLRWACLLSVMLGLGSILQPRSGDAEIYRWVDAQGRVQFGDRRPAAESVETVEIGAINTFEGVEVDPVEPSQRSGPSGAKPRRVVMYTTDWCGVCARAKRFLTEQGIPFVDYDIEADPKARAAFDRLKGRGVPLLLVGNERMHGFSEQRFMQLYSAPIAPGR